MAPQLLGYYWVSSWPRLSQVPPWPCSSHFQRRRVLRLAPPLRRAGAVRVVADAGPALALDRGGGAVEIQFPTEEEGAAGNVEVDEAVDEREKMRRMRISQANKGNTPWNKGRKHSPETLQRIRERTRLAMQDPKLPFLFGVPLLERTAAETAHLIVGRTGKHLFLSDRDGEKPPLLVRMVEDCDDGKFMLALRSFKRRVVYANITYDHIVGWKTSSIRRQHELPELELTANNEKYPHVIHVSTANLEGPQEEDSVDASLEDSLEEIMIRGLRKVTWERVDVCFHESRLKYNAHYNIQVRTHPMNSEGEDVIYHMIDNFLV